MNRIELYQKSVDVLLDAYNNGQLNHSNCSYCAVGNLCIEASKLTNIDNSNWFKLFYTNAESGELVNNIDAYSIQEVEEAKKLILATGYTIEELSSIEHAFESSLHNSIQGYDFWRDDKNKKQGQYMGLCAVLNILKEIHSTPEKQVQINKTRLETIYNNFQLV